MGTSNPLCRFDWFEMTRLETRTKESTHMREYVVLNIMCVVNVTAYNFATAANLDSREKV